MNPFLILVGAAFINNYVLTQFLGMCPFFGVSKKIESALGMGIAVLFVMTIASAITHTFYHFILIPLDIAYLQTVVFILIIASIVQFVEVFMKKAFRKLYTMLGVYLPMITTNCVIFGATLINIKDNYSFLGAIENSIGAGGGFLLALVLLAAIREKYDNHPDVPWIFQGFPLALFSAGLMSIAFMGFQGLIAGG
ncbi:MAG: RnfABCDGE type electron transport complex subunit A [Treponema sp.]|jgi:electron transport complex protein RnfA|nr:RnfABCDGE type electron transport complex subunit A [Treponema sp.]